jgi:hypothetical protein
MPDKFIVPQFIDKEDQILGPVTVRQFLIVLVDMFTIFIASRILAVPYFIAYALIAAGLGATFAFLKINGQPFHIFFINFLQTVLRPPLRVWDKRYTDAEQRATVEALAAAAERRERQAEQTYTDNARSAADAYAQNLRAARASADRTRDSYDRLRDAIASAAPASCPGPASAAAGAADGATQLRKVLGSCAAALRDLAAAADQDAAQLGGLQAHVRAIGLAPAASAPVD